VTRRLVAAFTVVGTLGAGGAALRAGNQTLASPAASVPASAPGTGFILGRVVDARTGAPVDDAIVTLQVLPVASTMTMHVGGVTSTTVPPARPVRTLVTGRGQFVFHDLPGGSMLITTTAPGYLAGGVGVRVPGGEPIAVPLNDGQHLADVTIALWPVASIEGTVLDESGDPIADVPVHLLTRTTGERRLVDGPVVRTDDRGAFRFASLNPGRYVVLVQSTTTSMPASLVDDYFSQLSDRVSPLVRGPVTAAPEPSVPGIRIGDTVFQPSSALARDAPPPAPDGALLIYGTTFYPGGPTLLPAAGIDVAAGDDRTGINLMLPLVRTVAVSGLVAESGGPASEMALRLVPADTEDWMSEAGFEAAWTTTDDRGAFTFLGVPPGQYVIESRADTRWVRAPVSVTNTPVVDLSLTAHPNLRVSGRIRFAGTSPAPSPGAGALNLIDLRRAVQPPSVALMPDGQFSVQGCEPGAYAIDAPTLTVQGVSWTVVSITGAGRDLLKQPLDLDMDVSDLVVTFTDHPTEITGAVRTAAPVTEPLAVVVFPADYSAAADTGMFALRTATVAVASDRYVVDGLPPGHYLMAAIPASDLAVWDAPRLLQVVASQASAVTLTDRAHVTLDLKAVDIR